MKGGKKLTLGMTERGTRSLAPAIAEVTFEILVNYRAEPAANGRGVLAALGGTLSITWLLGSRRKSPHPTPTPGQRDGCAVVGDGGEMPYFALGVWNNENYPLCLQCWSCS